MSAQPQFCDEETFWNTLDANDRDTRIDVDADARLYCTNAPQLNIVIHNLSRHGLRATAELPPFVGQAVEIELAGFGRFHGLVRWRHQQKFGVQTFDSLDLSLFVDGME